jgi:flagellin
MRRQIRGLDQATDNIQDGISLVQIADGALAESMDNMQRVNELAIKAANETLTDEDRSYIQEEVRQLLKEVDRTAMTTSFNDKIFPLNGDPITTTLTGIFTEQTVIVHNQGTNDLLYDGIFYAPGQDCTVTGVLTFGNAHRIGIVGNAGTGGGMMGAFGGEMTYRGTGDPSYAVIRKTTMDDVLEDADGYIYSYDAFGYREWYGNNGAAYHEERFNPGFDTSLLLTKEKQQEKSEPLYILVGAEKDQLIDIEMVNATSEGLGVGGISLSTASSAREAIGQVKNAIAKIAEYRSNFGAKQNRLEHSYKNTTNVVENTQHAESIIRDTDMATEMVRYSNNNILMQAGQSMLAQANQTNQGVMALLQ